MNDIKKLSLKVKLGYGSCDLGGNLFFTVIGFLLMNYLTDEVGLSATLAGFALMIGKIWDAVTDPTVGYLSDKTRTRWGRRLPWLLFGSIPLGLSFFYLFTNPHITDQNNLFIWASVSVVLLSTFYTFVNIPYNALTPELTKDFDEKTALNGYRMIFAVVGTLIGFGASLPIIQAFPKKSTGYMVLGLIFGLLMTITALVPFFTVKEPPLPEKDRSGGQSLFRSYLEAFKNKPFLFILIPWAFNIVGITIIMGALIYYFKYIFNNEAALTPAMMIMVLTAMVFIPISVKVSKRIGKKNTYFTGISIFSAAVLLFYFFGHTFGVSFVYIVMFIAGMGFSTHYVMPWAIVPDTVEYDYSLSGQRREGIYYGLWTFTIKIGQALAALLIGVVLDQFGFKANVNQSDMAIWGIRLLVGPFPVVFFLAANFVLFFYPIDKKKYEEIMATIKDMESKGAN